MTAQACPPSPVPHRKSGSGLFWNMLIKLNYLPADGVLRDCGAAYSSIEIKPGMTVDFDVLTWDDGWEFDCPAVLLFPVVKCFESGISGDRLIESVLEDACIADDPTLRSDDFQKQWGWRGYKLPVLRRRFRESLSGKRFPISNYIAKRRTVIFTPGEFGFDWSYSK